MKTYDSVPDMLRGEGSPELATAVEQRLAESNTAGPEPKAPDWNELKLAINNAIWMHAPETLTLKQAEEAACRAIGYIGECWAATNTKYAR